MCSNDIITHLWRERRRNSRKAIKSKIYGQIMQVAMQFMCGLLSTSHPSIPTTSTCIPSISTLSSPTTSTGLGCNKTTNCCVLERFWKCTESFNYILAFIHCSPSCATWSGLVCRLFGSMQYVPHTLINCTLSSASSRNLMCVVTLFRIHVHRVICM